MIDLENLLLGLRPEHEGILFDLLEFDAVFDELGIVDYLHLPLAYF